ncbi:MAG: branched-chain amino acid transporter [Xanthobacteraceae bacterium]|jgi:uncharacterized membrane protein|nr:branched-chain amino acid transporter [Xanthobacteraceae bacterium]
MIANEPFAFMAALLAMSAATYLMRAGGFWLMGRVPIGPRVKRMLEALPGSVVAATVLPIVIKSGPSALVAVVASLAAMLVTRNDFCAVLAGIGAAALMRAGGF